MRRINALAKLSDEPGKITRTFASPAMRRSNELAAQWMREAGMQTRVDAAGNLVGHLPGGKPQAKVFLLGSHLDTVRDAGRFDGTLGVVLAIACLEDLHRRKIKLPFAVEVIGFSDEEGIRFQTACLGSKAVAGSFDARDLKLADANGISMADAIRDFGGDPAQLKSARLIPASLLGYVEVHIEQGSVLERKNAAVGIVTGIAGQSRLRIGFSGRAGHAGTVPMKFRQDALCAAAEFVLAVEELARHTAGLVATVGQLAVQPGASNVIPGEAQLTLDVRHASDSVRRQAQTRLKRAAREISARRKLKVVVKVLSETAAVDCSKDLSAHLALCAHRWQKKIPRLPSGAGHDAAIMARITPVTMLFVRCQGGISHHPDESVKVGDVQLAFHVLGDFILRLAKTHEPL